jgi:hypothetical protein
MPDHPTRSDGTNTPTGNGESPQNASPNEHNASTTSPAGSSALASRPHRATGPRSSAGKARTKHNAVKHAIFAKAVVLKDESAAEFSALLNGIREHFNPWGALEEVLVEKLATELWRYRRFLFAERAEIEKVTEFTDYIEKAKQAEDAHQILNESTFVEHTLKKGIGLLRHAENPLMLAKCLEYLQELHANIKARGFNHELDEQFFLAIYGPSEHLDETLMGAYGRYLYTAEASDEVRKQNNFCLREECVARFLEEIKVEINRLSGLKRTQSSIASQRTKLEKLSVGVPDSPALDRLLRYQAAISREFDRNLSQLERIQRLRRGQPVLPAIKVELTT